MLLSTTVLRPIRESIWTRDGITGELKLSSKCTKLAQAICVIVNMECEGGPADETCKPHYRICRLDVR